MKKQHADILIINGLIYTVDDSMSVVEAVAIADGLIIATGTTEQLSEKFNPGQTIDLQGKSAYPGFTDAHCHFKGYAGSLHWAWLGEAKSLKEMLATLSVHEKTLADPGTWLLGRGWDQNNWPGNPLPVKELLDSLFPNRPVMLVRTDGHAVAVNSVVLEKAGLSSIADDRAGEILMERGRPNGILMENTADMVKAMVPPPAHSEQIAAHIQAQENCFAVGLTCVHDAGLSYSSVMLIDSLQKSGELMMNVYAMLNPDKENFEKLVYKGIYVTDKLVARSVKLYADGALGSRGALLKEDYSDKPGYRGISVTPYDSMLWVAKACYELGYQVCTHAIGDSANKIVLELYSSVLREPNDFRWRIEHAQVVDPVDRHYFSDYCIIPSVNTVHASSDMEWVATRLNEERMKGAYAYHDLLLENGWLCNGSDFPVEPINPLFGFHAAVSRTDRNGMPHGGFQPENALDRSDALRAMTIWAAKAGFWEKQRGSLEVGKKADLVVLDRDIMTVPGNEIHRAKVLYTFVDGSLVYSVEQ